MPIPTAIIVSISTGTKSPSTPPKFSSPNSQNPKHLLAPVFRHLSLMERHTIWNHRWVWGAVSIMRFVWHGCSASCDPCGSGCSASCDSCGSGCSASSTVSPVLMSWPFIRHLQARPHATHLRCILQVIKVTVHQCQLHKNLPLLVLNPFVFLIVFFFVCALNIDEYVCHVRFRVLWWIKVLRLSIFPGLRPLSLLLVSWLSPWPWKSTPPLGFLGCLPGLGNPRPPLGFCCLWPWKSTPSYLPIF